MTTNRDLQCRRLGWDPRKSKSLAGRSLSLSVSGPSVGWAREAQLRFFYLQRATAFFFSGSGAGRLVKLLYCCLLLVPLLLLLLLLYFAGTAWAQGRTGSGGAGKRRRCVRKPGNQINE